MSNEADVHSFLESVSLITSPEEFEVGVGDNNHDGCDDEGHSSSTPHKMACEALDVDFDHHWSSPTTT